MTTRQTKLTIFGLPKPFEGHIGKIQSNAIGSWCALGDQVEVLLFGDETGAEECAARFGCRHFPEIKRNQHGTPLLNDVFATVASEASGQVLLYANCDIVFGNDLVAAVEQLQASELDDYLMIGRRVDVDFEEHLNFECSRWKSTIDDAASERGKLAPVVCKDYFGFPKGSYSEIPAFAIGRGNWDNWMVHHANSRRVPVIDATKQIKAIHQNHDYAHLKKGRLEAYVNGDEAVENKRLAGGMHLVSGCGATWRLNETGPQKLRRPLSAAFMRDLPSFVSLLGNLFIYGRKSERRSGEEVNAEEQKSSI